MLDGSNPRKEQLEALRAIPLFADVAESDLEAIAEHLIERQYAKNVTIVEEGLPGEYMYVLREGRVKVTKLSEDGREKIMDFLEVGAFFGEMSLLDRAPRSASVKALEPVRVLALSRGDFLAHLRTSPDLALAVIQVLTRRLREADVQASSMSFQRVKERTQGLLQRMARTAAEADADMGLPPGRVITPPLTHQQIADMVGTSRETVTRVVKQLKQDGWLEQRRKRYVVPPPESD